MGRLACGYKKQGSIFHGCVGGGVTLSMGIAVGRVMGSAAQGKGVKKRKKRAKVIGNEVSKFFFK
jgi:hypothetical protein